MAAIKATKLNTIFGPSPGAEGPRRTRSQLLEDEARRRSVAEGQEVSVRDDRREQQTASRSQARGKLQPIGIARKRGRACRPCRAPTASRSRSARSRSIEELSLIVAEGEALGIVGPNGAGKTTLLNLMRQPSRPTAAASCFDGSDITRLCRQRALPRRHRAARIRSRIPSRGSRVFENVLVGAIYGAAERRRPCSRSASTALERRGLLAQGQRARGHADAAERKRLELARALATQPRVLLLDEIAGGLTEPEVLELVATIERAHARGSGDRLDRAHRARAASPSWIDCVAMDSRTHADRRRPADVMASEPGGAARLPGDRRCMSLLVVRHARRLLRRLPGAVRRLLDVAEGETVAIIGANGAGKSPCSRRWPARCRPSLRRVSFDGEAIGGLPAHAPRQAGISLVPEGRRIFPSLTVEENLRIGAHRGRRGPWTLDARVRASSPPWPRSSRRPGTLSGGEQQMLRHRPRADGEPAAAAPRRDLARPGPDGHQDDLRDAWRRSPPKAPRSCSSNRTWARRSQLADRVYCLLEGRVSLHAATSELTRERIVAGLLRSADLMVWVNQVVQGILLGGLYALFATGLSLIFGVMRLVNLAHGDLIVLASFLARAGGRPRLESSRDAGAADPVDGSARLRAAIRLLNACSATSSPPILVTFGLAMIIQNALLEHFSADSAAAAPGGDRDGEHQGQRPDLDRLVSAADVAVAVVLLIGLQLLIRHTRRGRRSARRPTTSGRHSWSGCVNPDPWPRIARSQRARRPWPAGSASGWSTAQLSTTANTTGSRSRAAVHRACGEYIVDPSPTTHSTGRPDPATSPQAAGMPHPRPPPRQKKYVPGTSV